MPPGQNASQKKNASWKECLLERMPPGYFVTRKKCLLRTKKLLYPQTKVGDILDSGPSRRRRRRRRRNFLVDAITQKQINIFFSNLVHMLRVPKGRSLF